jgi:hypothetical protein
MPALYAAVVPHRQYLSAALVPLAVSRPSGKNAAHDDAL